ncbi:hypothetical protein [Roseinatronobacter alkalisoli]|uniref:Uncharacterized protein n=1 Tax=Roseinatronobacter alkalisoli TaxID=3028235 RepID=A0ABT5TG09_9RHOB|nr:hypothetical protein [Roseinatronobacter sp. HJB301]MDD7972858.1 hypothetical protein [Roseinatronobacter sp. HJB301]
MRIMVTAEARGIIADEDTAIPERREAVSFRSGHGARRQLDCCANPQIAALPTPLREMSVIKTAIVQFVMGGKNE